MPRPPQSSHCTLGVLSSWYIVIIAVIVVWKLDRLARSTRDLLNTMETISEAGGKFQSISEPWANTTTHAGKMIMTVFAGIAEFERDLIRERTGAGREAAKQRGVRFGRPRKLNTDQAKVQRSCSPRARRFETSQGRSTYTRPRFIAWLPLHDAYAVIPPYPRLHGINLDKLLA